MSVALLCVIGTIITAGALVIADNWRVTIPLLFGVDLFRVGVIAQANLGFDTGRSTIVIVELVTAASVAAILLLTALRFTRPFATEQLDEFALFELRRVARRAQSQRAQITGGRSQTLITLGVLLLAGLATWLLGQAYPVARDPLIDPAWMFSLLCGLLTLILANDVLKLGLGLLLLVGSAKLLYVGVAIQLNVLHIGLLEALSLLLALIVAFLCALLYGRLHTLELGSLFERS